MADAPATKREIQKMLDEAVRDMREDARRKFKDLEDKFLYKWNVDEMERMFRDLDRKMETIERKIDDLADSLDQSKGEH